MNRLSSYLSLFASTGTLVCCALPSLLVALGMGATMAGLVSAVPQLIWLSQYKAYVFAISGVLILGSAILQYNARNAPCPIDPAQARDLLGLGLSVTLNAPIEDTRFGVFRM